MEDLAVLVTLSSGPSCMDKQKSESHSLKFIITLLQSQVEKRTFPYLVSNQWGNRPILN